LKKKEPSTLKKHFVNVRSDECNDAKVEKPNMLIRFANYTAASWLLTQEPQQWHTIVILNSGVDPTDFVQTQSLSYLTLRFDDIEEARSSKQLPTKDVIAQGIMFARGKYKLLVSCHAGQGRSAALAYVIGCQAHGPAEAVKMLNPMRHRPNRRVVALGAEVIDIPEALTTLDEWRRTHAYIQLSDYYDEIERELEALEAQGASNRICRY
jgi:predicted protein tyrosine phosphatase